MLSLTGLSGVLLVLLAGWLVVKSWVKARKVKQLAASLGCAPPPTLHNENWIGNSVLRASMKAQKEDRGPQFVHDTMNSVSRSCHTVRVPILNFDIVVTRDPENVRQLFSSADFDISGTRQMSWMPLMGKGIFTSRGETWKHSRAILRPQFSKGMNNPPHIEERHISSLARHFPADATTGWTQEVDLLPLIFKFTLDTATEFIFGKSTESLTNSTDIDHHFNSAKVWIDKRGALSKFYFLLNTKEFRDNCAAIHAFADTIVRERLAHRVDRKTDPEKVHLDYPNGGERYDLLSQLVETTQNPEELRNEMLHVLVAGRDTTGCLLAWTLTLLSHHPAVFQKLRTAILKEYGSRAPSDYKGLSGIPYLQWVLSETIRFAAIIPLNERVALRDTTLPRGGGPDGKDKVFVPEGTQVLIPFYSMQRREDLWGADVNEFRPERWEECRPGWEYIPFGAGARKCLGQQFARIEVSYVVARFCQRYDQIESLGKADDLSRMHHAIENRPGNGVRVRLHEAAAPVSAA